MIDLTLREKILKSLFESNKTTGELLASLRYGKTKYNAIDKDLKKLAAEGLIFADKRKIKGSRGQPPTFYGVVFELPTLQKILDDHSSLRSAMQNNDTVLSLLVKKQFWLIDYKAELEKKKAEHEAELKAYRFDCDSCLQLSQPPLCGEDEQFRQNCIELSKNPKPLVNPKREAITQMIKESEKKHADEIQSQLIMEFKKRLRLSPHFFELCLTNEPTELKEQFDLIYGYTVSKHLKKHPTGILTLGDEPGLEQWAYFTTIFEICMFHDVLEKKASEEAIRELSKTNEYQAHLLEDKERLDILTYYEDPKTLQWMYEQEWGTPKPLKSVKINFKAIEQNQKLKNMSGLNNFLNENQFSEEETALSQLIVGWLLKRREHISLKDIMSELTEKGATYSNTFVLNTLEKLTKTKRQDGVAHPVIGTVNRISWWSYVI